MQVKKKNISIELKQKIYEAYSEKCKNQSKNNCFITFILVPNICELNGTFARNFREMRTTQ